MIMPERIRSSRWAAIVVHEWFTPGDAAAAAPRTAPADMVPSMADLDDPRPQPRLAVLVNRGSGTVRSRRPVTLKGELAAGFAERGLPASVDLVSSDELRAAAEGALDDFRRGEVRAVVVAGGDGSVRAVASVIAGTDLPMGVLPLGTLNHFARDLGIPLDLQGATAVIARGITRPVDVGEVNGRVFVNNSSIGIYPLMVV